MSSLTDSARPGRACPLDYYYGPQALAASATLATDSLWIAGGLYGNTLALERLDSRSRSPAQVAVAAIPTGSATRM